jgi:hypothetical protein
VARIVISVAVIVALYRNATGVALAVGVIIAAWSLIDLAVWMIRQSRTT